MTERFSVSAFFLIIQDSSLASRVRNSETDESVCAAVALVPRINCRNMRVTDQSLTITTQITVPKNDKCLHVKVSKPGHTHKHIHLKVDGPVRDLYA